MRASGPQSSLWVRFCTVVFRIFVVVAVLVALIAGGWMLYRAIGPQTFADRNEFTRTVAQLLGALALAVSLFFAWKTLLENQKANRERERLSQEGNITDRYSKAIEQLGATASDGTPRLELRLGGIYALQRIARDSERDHWPIMQILMAYLQANSPAKPTDYAEMARMTAENEYLEVLRDFNLRHDIAAIVQVLLKRERFLGNGETLSFELTFCYLRGAQFFDIHPVHFEKSNFAHSNLDGAKFIAAHLEQANFFGASLAGADLSGAELPWAKLAHCNLSLAKAELAHFEGAEFGGANLRGANLIGAYLHGANLEAAASLQDTNLHGATGLTDEQRQICIAMGAPIEASAG